MTKGFRLSVARRTFLVGVAVAFAVTLVLVARDRIGSRASGSSSGGGYVGGDFHSLVADPAVPGRLFVGGHQAVSVSSDGGATWAEVPSLADADAMGWSFNDTAIWVGGHPGLVKTSFNTDTAKGRSTGLTGTDVHAFGGDDRVMYAAGPGVGFIKSTDGATTWTTVSAAVGQSFFGRILVDPTDIDHIVAADAANGVLSSRDGGATWKRLKPTPSSWVSSPDGLVTLFASGGDGIAVSTDGGASWSTLTVPVSATMVEADPTTPDHLYAGAHDGDLVRVWSSKDNGTTWQTP